jgi:multicomponent Na+:H+ antiporter subunit F
VRVVIVISSVMLVAAAVLTLRRVEAGPSVLDRVVGMDVLVSTILAAFVLYAAWTGRTDFIAVMVVLSLVGFVGAVTLARFVAAESEDEARILSPQEVAELEEQQTAVIDALDSAVAGVEEIGVLGRDVLPEAGPLEAGPPEDGPPEAGPEAGERRDGGAR